MTTTHEGPLEIKIKRDIRGTRPHRGHMGSKPVEPAASAVSSIQARCLDIPPGHPTACLGDAAKSRTASTIAIQAVLDAAAAHR